MTEIQSFEPASLPIEVWNQVFQYSDVNDLKNLSLVCKTFYDMIGEMPDVIDRICIALNVGKKQNIRSLLKCGRMYTNINFMLISNFEPFLKIIEKFGPTLRILSIGLGEMTEEEMITIFKVAKNLKSLYVQMLDLTKIKKKKKPKEEEENERFVFTKLETFVYIASDIPNIECYLPDTLRKIIFFCLNDERNTVDSFLKILDKQRILKELKLVSLNCNVPAHPSFLEMIDDAEMKFRLDILNITVLNQRGNERIQKFIKSQAESLKRLHISNIPVHLFNDVFSNMPNMKYLDINCKTFLQLPKTFMCSSVKKLSFSAPIYTSYCSSFVKQFPNLQEIIINNHINSQLLNQIGSNCKHLKKLSLKKFSNESFEGVKLDGLQELVISGTKFELDDIEHTIAAVKNLEILKIENFLVKSSLLFWLLENLKKLKNLDICNGSKLKAVFFSRFSLHFKNLQRLKISNIEEPIEDFKECFKQFPDLKLFLDKNVAAGGEEESEDDTDTERYDSDD